MGPFNALLLMIAAIAFMVAMFAIFREMVTWYWKINQAIDLLTKIEENTRKT